MKNTLWQKAFLLLFVYACKSSGSRKELELKLQDRSLKKGRAAPGAFSLSQSRRRGSQSKTLNPAASGNANSSTDAVGSQVGSGSTGSGAGSDIDQFFDSVPAAASSPTKARALGAGRASSGVAPQASFSAPHVNVPAGTGAGSGAGAGAGTTSSSESSASEASLAPQEEAQEKSKCLEACEAMIKGYTNNHEYMEKISSHSEDMSIFSLDIRREANVVWEGCIDFGTDAGDSARSELNTFLKECKGGVTTKVSSCLSKNIIFRETDSLSAEKKRQLQECRKSMKRASGKSQNTAKKTGGAPGTSPH
ncbi:MAG: hypothetical protein R3A80_02825 [Bdellovibrionota bacterium]